jgi:type IV fimbrial biogenesis protein FimT
VTVCPSFDGKICATVPEWEQGWIIFADANANGVVNGGEAILRLRQGDPEAGTIRSGKRRITYQSTGFSPGFNDTLRVCDSRGVTKARSVIVSMQGRVRVAARAAQCSE